MDAIIGLKIFQTHRNSTTETGHWHKGQQLLLICRRINGTELAADISDVLEQQRRKLLEFHGTYEQHRQTSVFIHRYLCK